MADKPRRYHVATLFDALSSAISRTERIGQAREVMLPCLRIPSRMFVETELLVVQRDQRVHLRGFAGWKQACCKPNKENESCNGEERPGVSR